MLVYVLDVWIFVQCSVSRDVLTWHLMLKISGRIIADAAIMYKIIFPWSRFLVNLHSLERQPKVCNHGDEAMMIHKKLFGTWYFWTSHSLILQKYREFEHIYIKNNELAFAKNACTTSSWATAWECDGHRSRAFNQSTGFITKGMQFC